MSIQVDTTNWIKGKHYPEWMNEISLSMISKGYLLPDEDVFGAFKRVSRAASRRLKRKDQLKNFIKERANQKLIELGYNPIYNDIDPNLLKQMEWFGHLTSGKTHQDFFANRVTDYSKSTADWSDL